MKRLLFCLVALIAVMAMVAPSYAVEMKINGIKRIKFISDNNMDGTDSEGGANDDGRRFVHQRLRLYFTSIASENLKMVYKNEIDFNWGDASGSAATRGTGGGVGGDGVNLETKNVYLEFMVPDTPVKATLGLQGITLHKGWFISDDISAARFDLNFDPLTIMAYWANASDTDFADESDTVYQLVASGAYKAENMDARLTLGYEKGGNEIRTGAPPAITGNAGIKDDDLFVLMGEFNMSFDIVSFFVIAGKNFGKIDGDSTAAGVAADRDYSGFMFDVGADVALDMATLRARFIYTSGDDEDTTKTFGNDDDWVSMTGETFSWAEIVSDGYFWESNSSMAQIGTANKPSNMYAIGGGATVKPTDTTTIALDIWYIAMVEDRTVGAKKEDTIGTEVDLKLTQKVYDNLDALIIGAYMFADDGYGTAGASNKGDDGWVVGMGLNYKF